MSGRRSRSLRRCVPTCSRLMKPPGAQRQSVRHLRVTGTLGVLRSGAEQGLVNVPHLLERLKATSFYLDETLLNAVFDRGLKR